MLRVYPGQSYEVHTEINKGCSNSLRERDMHRFRSLNAAQSEKIT